MNPIIKVATQTPRRAFLSRKRHMIAACLCTYMASQLLPGMWGEPSMSCFQANATDASVRRKVASFLESGDRKLVDVVNFMQRSDFRLRTAIVDNSKVDKWSKPIKPRDLVLVFRANDSNWQCVPFGLLRMVPMSSTKLVSVVSSLPNPGEAGNPEITVDQIPIDN